MEKSNRRRILHALIAILTALVLWVYVDNRSSAESKMTVRDIPVAPMLNSLNKRKYYSLFSTDFNERLHELARLAIRIIR